MKLMKRNVKNQREEKEVGARSSDPQKSYRNEYDRTWSSRAISTGQGRKSEQDLVEELREVNMFLQINLLVCHMLEFTLTAQYILDVYSVGVSSASLRAVSFVDFWKEGGRLFSL